MIEINLLVLVIFFECLSRIYCDNVNELFGGKILTE